MYAAKLKNVGKSYLMGTVLVPALVEVNINIRPNRFTVISGPSGSGKTSLLNLIGCIDQPDTGEIIIAGQSVRTLNDDELADFRAHHLSFIFQNFNLLPVLSAYENVEYPLLKLGISSQQRKARVQELLDAIGLSDKAKNLPSQLSGGQRQRVAIARALAPAPKIVIADEPTANLDSQTGATIIALMRRMQRQHQVSFIFSSHDPQVIAEADDSITIHDGRIVSSNDHSKITA